MTTDKTFKITYWASKHKKHITRKGKHDDKSRFGNQSKVFHIMFIMI